MIQKLGMGRCKRDKTRFQSYVNQDKAEQLKEPLNDIKQHNTQVGNLICVTISGIISSQDKRLLLYLFQKNGMGNF